MYFFLGRAEKLLVGRVFEYAFNRRVDNAYHFFSLRKRDWRSKTVLVPLVACVHKLTYTVPLLVDLLRKPQTLLALAMGHNVLEEGRRKAVFVFRRSGVLERVLSPLRTLTLFIWLQILLLFGLFKT